MVSVSMHYSPCIRIIQSPISSADCFKELELYFTGHLSMGNKLTADSNCEICAKQISDLVNTNFVAILDLGCEECHLQYH